MWQSQVPEVHKERVARGERKAFSPLRLIVNFPEKNAQKLERLPNTGAIPGGYLGKHMFDRYDHECDENRAGSLSPQHTFAYLPHAIDIIANLPK